MFFLDLQVKQQLNLTNSCQILRSFLIWLNKINNPLLYWVISMQDLNHDGAWWHNITGWHWHWFINNSAWTTATNIRVKPLALILFVLIKPNWQLIVFFILLYILIVIIKLFIANSISFKFLLHMNVLSGITNTSMKML